MDSSPETNLSLFIEKNKAENLIYIPLPRDMRIRKRKRLTRRCDIIYHFKETIQTNLCMPSEFFSSYHKDSEKVYKLIIEKNEINQKFHLRFYLIPFLLDNHDIFNLFCHFINFIQKATQKQETDNKLNVICWVAKETFLHSTVSEIIKNDYSLWCCELTICNEFPSLTIDEWITFEKKLDLTEFINSYFHIRLA